MVSIRRRRLLGLCSGKISPLDLLTGISDPGKITENSGEIAISTNGHPLPINNDHTPKDEITSQTAQGSPDLSASSPSKETPLQMFSEVKRRKRHRRKHVENREPCSKRGVYYKNRKWQAAIKVDKKQIHLGTVGSEEEAARLYDRAAFMCRREPNFELSEEEKRELRKYSWDEFLAMTRSAISNKKSQRRSDVSSRRKPHNDGACETETEQGNSGIST